MYLLTVDFGYKKLQAHPRPRQCPLLIRVSAQVTLCLGTGSTQRKEEFATVSVGLDEVGKFAWWLDFAFNNFKVGRGWTKVFRNDFRVSANTKIFIINTNR